MEELVQLIVKTYGVAGLIMLSPFAAVIFLWRHYIKVVEKHHKAIEDLQNKLHDLNQKRVDDAKAITERVITLVGEQSSLNKETNMALERVGDALALIPSIKR